MKSSYFSVNKIYGETSVHSLKSRINFIASKRKKKWLSIETNVQLTQCPSTHAPNFNESPIQTNRLPQASKTLWHSKARSIELQDLKTKRYLQCKADSERILVQLQAKRAEELKKKQLRRLRVLREQQQGRQALRAHEEARLKESHHIKQNVDEALQGQTAEAQQLQREEQRQLQRYEQQLTYRSLVMRRIQQLIQQDQQFG